MSSIEDVIARGRDLLAQVAPTPWHWVNPADDTARLSGEYHADLRTVSTRARKGSEYQLPEWVLSADELRGDTDAQMDSHADIIPFAVNVLERLFSEIERLKAELAAK